MTSAHRPTFDHAKGKDKKVVSSIAHKRALTSHSKLKFRSKRVRKNEEFYDDDTEETNDNGDGRKIPGLTEQKVLDLRQQIEGEGESDSDSDDDNDNNNEKSDNNASGTVKDIGEESSGEEKEDSANSESINSDDDDDDDDDAEALLREMELIKKERDEAEYKAKIEKKRAEEEEITSRAKTSNPLLNQETKPKKKSWRSAKTMSKKSNLSQTDRFSNDTLKSDFHKDFLDRYIK